MNKIITRKTTLAAIIYGSVLSIIGVVGSHKKPESKTYASMIFYGMGIALLGYILEPKEEKDIKPEIKK